jgi:hypothetical protein
MVKKGSEPLTSHHLKLYMGDFDELDRILGGKLSPSVAIRILVRNFILKTREKAQQSFKPLEVDIDFSDQTSEPELPGISVQQKPPRTD